MNEGTTARIAIERAAHLNGGVVGLARREPDSVASLAGVSRKTVLNLMSELARSGLVIRATDGRYVVRLENGHVNPIAIGPRLTRGRAYVSMWSIAERARLTTNVPRLVSVVVDRTPTQKVLELPELDVTFYFHQISETRFFGFSEQPLGDGLTAPLAGLEKALIDMLWFVDAPDVPPADEVFTMWQEAAHSSALNPRLLIRHAIRMDSPAVIRRVGYLMDRFAIRGGDELLPHRGSGKATLPLLRRDEPLHLPRNRWGVS